MSKSSSKPHQPSFHYFSALPPEIRILIWKCALAEPRLIKVRSLGAFPGASDHGFVRFPKLVASAPPLLQINRESRELALNVYETCLSTVIDPELQFFAPLPQVRTRGIPIFRRLLQKLNTFMGIALIRYTEPKLIPHSEIVSNGVLLQPSCDTIFFDPDTREDMMSFWVKGMTPERIKTTNIQSIVVSNTFLSHPTFFINYLFEIPPFVVLDSQMSGEWGPPLPNLKERFLVVEDYEWVSGRDERAFRIRYGMADGAPNYEIIKRSELRSSYRWGVLC